MAKYNPVKATAHDFVLQLNSITDEMMNPNNFLLALGRFAQLEESVKRKVIERFALTLEEGKTHRWNIDVMVDEIFED